ncbi:MAG: hypothetical protein JWM41_4095 [Gemmatimonadetes bacterium]|nr:hypothetical protein [Gemmatimonadota bacterium]
MAHPTTVGPYPYYPVEFDKNGAPVTPAQVNATMNAVSAPPAQGGLTDLFVISHGWNDDMPEAERLYETIFSHVGSVLQQKNAACDNVNARRVGVVGILWPSKKFDDAELIPGGAAAMPGDRTAGLGGSLDTLSALVDSGDATASLARAKALAPTLAASMDARDEFVRIVRAFMPHDANDEEPAVSDDLFTLNGDQLLQRLSRPAHGEQPAGGGAAGFTDWIGKAVDGAKSLVNLVTYYQMKNRAGVVGQSGVYDVLRRIRDIRPADGDNALRLHMMGHSFGCRLVTAAVAGPTGTDPLPVNSMSLLQAAFSHYGFAQSYDGTRDGFFRRVVTDPARIRGPLIITFTSKDKAVGVAYPIASRLARQVASALGDADDPYGGLGRNGAQKTPESQVVTLGQAGTPYWFAARGVYSLDANAVIGGHSDLGHDEVGWAIVSVVAGT